MPRLIPTLCWYSDAWPSINLAKAMGDTVTFGLNSEIWSPRVVRGDES